MVPTNWLKERIKCFINICIFCEASVRKNPNCKIMQGILGKFGLKSIDIPLPTSGISLHPPLCHCKYILENRVSVRPLPPGRADVPIYGVFFVEGVP